MTLDLGRGDRPSMRIGTSQMLGEIRVSSGHARTNESIRCIGKERKKKREGGGRGRGARLIRLTDQKQSQRNCRVTDIV
jgi:hypothetical protein